MSQALRSALMAGVMGTALFGWPSSSHAIFHWFCPQGCSSYSAARTTYAPPYLACYAPAPWTAAPASGCAPCAAPVSGCAPCAVPRMNCAPVQTAYYAPQTCYRPVVTAVPVTTYRPIRSCDPCSGCPTTYLQPATTWVRQVQYMPYTSYGISYGSPCAMGGCGSAISYGGMSAPGCNSCASGTVPSSATLAPMPQPSLNTPPAGTTTPPPAAAAPSTLTPTPAPAPKTFQESNTAPVDPRAKPIQSSTPAPLPGLTAPKTSNPTAARPVYHAAYYLVSGSQPTVTPASAQTVVVDDGGWRQARD